MSEERSIFTLKQVVNSIKTTIENRYQNTYWVKAEMHKLNSYPSGHAFPELVQKENDKIVAQINGTIWNAQLTKINQKFREVVKEPIKEGTTLLMQVKIVYHEIYGLTLQILDVDPNYTLGELQKEREATLKRLHQEGLLNKNQLLPFPLLPKRIAVISADSSKGLSDFMKVLNENPWGYKFFSMLFNAYLQGDLAVNSIIKQLEKIKKVKHHFDAVVIVRGGGGEVGMSCYNNYELCRAIASFDLPILTGIGHSTNLTVAEMIAFRNAITPTELADFLIQSFHDYAIPLKEAVLTAKKYCKNLLQLENNGFNQEIRALKSSVQLYNNKANNQLRELSQKLSLRAKSNIPLNFQRISMNRNRIHQLTTLLFGNEREKILEINKKTKRGIQRFYLDEMNKIIQIEKNIDLLNPIHILKRGYSITTLDGKAINENSVLENGQTILTTTADFKIHSNIFKIDKNE
jgi:exodeoxyribonuclease VII large subunit